jgi:hypothetical protein
MLKEIMYNTSASIYYNGGANHSYHMSAIISDPPSVVTAIASHGIWTESTSLVLNHHLCQYGSNHMLLGTLIGDYRHTRKSTR